MTGLEALKTIKIKCHPNSNPSPLVDNALDIVEKSLKALEIIKEKLVDVFKLYNCKTVEEYNQAQYRDCMLTEEEFDLLKGILNDE